MRQISALLIKYGLTAVILMVVLPLFGQATVIATLSVAFAVAVVTFWADDLSVLPSMGSLAAVIGGLIVSTGVIYAAQYFLPNLRINLFGALAVSAFVGVGEWFYHRLLKRYLV